MAYVDVAYVKMIGSLPGSDIDALEALYPGIFDVVALAVSRMFDGKLWKRYDAPFKVPYPEALKWHVAKVISFELLKKRGFNPTSEQDKVVIDDNEKALAWLENAADPEKGTIELPLREDTTAEGVTRGAPLGSSDASPYAWVDRQAEDIGNG